ncbi:hypothetical protein JTE90_010452 [Oedothorax gibbosus]|uniref:Uncharacterized protein n=1 Tax=Oedothorax gibbosus TaxID=931172 RepID=A0AAV6W0D8_9ARAC|nr:hypothetical protein JTE90_010452 [Oedothorax gibbosus]
MQQKHKFYKLQHQQQSFKTQQFIFFTQSTPKKVHQQFLSHNRTLNFYPAAARKTNYYPNANHKRNFRKTTQNSAAKPAFQSCERSSAAGKPELRRGKTGLAPHNLRHSTAEVPQVEKAAESAKHSRSFRCQLPTQCPSKPSSHTGRLKQARGGAAHQHLNCAELGGRIRG